jgi:hypothetical protein
MPDQYDPGLGRIGRGRAAEQPALARAPEPPAFGGHPRRGGHRPRRGNRLRVRHAAAGDPRGDQATSGFSDIPIDHAARAIVSMQPSGAPAQP